MTKYVTKMTEEKIPEDIACDICKKVYNYEKDWEEVQEFHHIRFRGGYGSVFGDDIAFKADICQHCLKDILGQYITEDEDAVL